MNSETKPPKSPKNLPDGHQRSTSFSHLLEIIKDNPTWLTDSPLNSIWLGQINLAAHDDNGNLIDPNSDDKNWGYESLLHMTNVGLIPLPKLITWGQYKQWAIENDKNWGDAKHFADTYTSFIPHTSISQPLKDPDNPNHRQWWWVDDEGSPLSDLEDIMTEDNVKKWEEYKLANIDKLTRSGDADTTTMSFLSMRYHSAKLHWLMIDIQKNGLRAPVMMSIHPNNISVHPGSVRFMAYAELDNEDFPIILWDEENIFQDVTPSTIEQYIALWKRYVTGKNIPVDGDAKEYNTLSFLATQDRVETASPESPKGSDTRGLLGGGGFRSEIYEHCARMHKLFAKKKIQIYVGHDSRHKINSKYYLSDLCADLMDTQIKRSNDVNECIFGGSADIKKLDVATIPEYTRPYANQSTEFTYSRFLLPYLENYEGFSIFTDDDIFFAKDPLTLFYWMNPDDAVACIKYPSHSFEESKFNGEENVIYPKKLWSSFMIFNNSHPDCKKLPPESLNTWTGKQLHQFEWTDKISEIPDRYMYTEGYSKSSPIYDGGRPKSHYERPELAVHYTRGGPWVENMNCDGINIDMFEAFKEKSNCNISVDK